MGKGAHVQNINGQNVKVSIVGASGYTGVELLRLLSHHPFSRVVHITSRQFENQRLCDIFPKFLNGKFSNLTFEKFDVKTISSDSDIVFCCLPHAASFPIIKSLIAKNENLKIIDFSADFRFKNLKTYENTYNVKHTAALLAKKFVYGLPEIFRRNIIGKKLIANPGCYPTSIIIGLYPIKDLIDKKSPVIADSKSGASGAGRKVKLDLIFNEVDENFKAYALSGHRHQPEISEKLGIEKLKFVPHLLPIKRGILSTIYFKTDLDENKLRKIYRNFYKNEFFVRLREKPPEINDVVGTNFCDLFIKKDESTGLGIVISVIDNLIKGASGQAVQNMNIICGFDEKTGLTDLA